MAHQSSRKRPAESTPLLAAMDEGVHQISADAFIFDIAL
jgi:hypothetical protein